MWPFKKIILPAGTSAYAWKKYLGLRSGYVLFIDQIARDSVILDLDIVSLISLNVIHELSHLCHWDCDSHGHGETDKQKLSIANWNIVIAKAMGDNKMRFAFEFQYAALMSLTLNERIKDKATFTYPDIMMDIAVRSISK